MGELSDKENCLIIDGENNNGGPEEIKIVKSELNDSFEAGHPEYRRSFTKIRSKTFKRNFSTVNNSLIKAKEAPLIKAPNSHIRFDDAGEPILNLRPRGSVQSKASSDGFITVQSKSKRKKNHVESLVEPPTTRLTLGFVCSSPSPPRSACNSPTPPSSEEDITPRDRTDSNYSPRISKYWAQRYRLFTRYDEGIMLDEEAWYSVTPEKIAIDIAEKMSCGLIVDAFCGVGGNAIQFAKTCDRVVAVDIDSRKIEMARNNARIYGVEDKIEFILGDFFTIAPRLVADAMFLSPPWGGPEYLSTKFYNLQKMGSSIDGFKVFSIAKSVTPNIAFFVPKNTRIKQLLSLSAGVGGKVCVEKNVINHKTKVMTAYYGKFVRK